MSSLAAASAPLMLSVSGCRGIFGRTMTPEVAARFAMVVAAQLRETAASGGGADGSQSRRPVVVLARDGRAAGDVLLRAAAAGLAAGGCDALDCGVAMTPTVGVMVDAHAAAAGLIITASHNPQEWNGLKVVMRADTLDRGIVDACAPAKSTADAIIARFKQVSGMSGGGAGARAAGVGPLDIGTITESPRGGLGLPSASTTAHLERLRHALKELGMHDDRRSMAIKCIVDSVNASGVEASREFLGARLVHHVGAGTSGIFPHTPEPTRENLTSLCEFVARKRADVGFAQDPDADRLAIIDERGEYIGEEYTLVLCAEAILGAMVEKHGPDAARGKVMVINLSTSRMIEDVAAKYGARVLRAAVGEANVVELMKRTSGGGAILGGEGNGGVIWPRVTYIRDSLTAMALVIGLLARTGKTVSQLVSETPSYAIIKKKVDLPDLGRAAPTLAAVKQRFAAMAASGEVKIDEQDGVRIDFGKRGWLHVRASNTEPILRMIAEAPSMEEADKLATIGE
ncbi:MAG: hypothetical protein KF699_05320 [Phycisphaeraceae bacterium]|nr:hypothetical protein [Phycisphaeraceae bacterium]